MKNLLLFCICILLLSSSKAQFEKGQKMITGQFSFSDQKVQSGSSTSSPNSSYIFASFSLSHFTNPTTIKGFGINYGYNDNSYNITSTYGAFYNCTKLEALTKRVYLSFGGTAAINYRNYIFNNPNFNANTQTSITPSLSIGLGLLYHLNDRFLVTASVLNLASLYCSFDNSETFPNGGSPITTKSHTLGLSSGLTGYSLSSIGLGFNYLLKKK
jgi:hypothetical protein